MKKSVVDIAKTNAFSDIFVDYIKGKSQLDPFYKYSPNISSFRKVIADQGKEVTDRNLLVKVLEEQYEVSNLSAKGRTPSEKLVRQKSDSFGETLNLPMGEDTLWQTSLNLLEEQNTFTVCTGHQLCLFTGTLYFIYKIITTINLAEELKKNYPEYNFVPVFWMSTEDHDFEEINHINLFGRKLEWKRESAVDDRQLATGSIATKTLADVIDELKNILGDGHSADELIKLFKETYLEHNNLADATRFLVHSLFGKYGLIVIDADDGRLKKQFAEIVKDDLLNNTNFKIIKSTIQQLKNSNYQAQVNPREINCFYLKDGERKRIVKTSEEVHDSKAEILLTDDLLNELNTNPERFSPNVVLRPLYQQKILPNLAYIGGPGEIAYWLEYKEMFEYHKVNFPVLVPRNFVMLVDAKSNQQWTKLGFKEDDYFSYSDVLIKEYILNHSHSHLSFTEEQAQLEKLYSDISLKAAQIDPTLKAAVLAEQQAAINSLKSIEKKLFKAEKLKSETVVNQVKKIKDKLFPHGELQERYDNFIPYYLRYGNGFIDLLKKELIPLQNNFILLSE